MEDSKGSKKGWSPFKSTNMSGNAGNNVAARGGKWGNSLPTHKPTGKAFSMPDPDRKTHGPK